MNSNDRHVPNLSTDEVRQGETPGVGRYVLSISLTLAVVAGILLLLWTWLG